MNKYNSEYKYWKKKYIEIKGFTRKIQRGGNLTAEEIKKLRTCIVNNSCADRECYTVNGKCIPKSFKNTLDKTKPETPEEISSKVDMCPKTREVANCGPEETCLFMDGACIHKDYKDERWFQGIRQREVNTHKAINYAKYRLVRDKQEEYSTNINTTNEYIRANKNKVLNIPEYKRIKTNIDFLEGILSGRMITFVGGKIKLASTLNAEVDIKEIIKSLKKSLKEIKKYVDEVLFTELIYSESKEQEMESFNRLKLFAKNNIKTSGLEFGWTITVINAFLGWFGYNVEKFIDQIIYDILYIDNYSDLIYNWIDGGLTMFEEDNKNKQITATINDLINIHAKKIFSGGIVLDMINTTDIINSIKNNTFNLYCFNKLSSTNDNAILLVKEIKKVKKNYETGGYVITKANGENITKADFIESLVPIKNLFNNLRLVYEL